MSETTQEGQHRLSPASERPTRPIQSHVAHVARAATRPIVTIMMMAVIAQIVIERITPPDWFIYGLAMPVILSWFGERTVRRFKGEH